MSPSLPPDEAPAARAPKRLPVEGPLVSVIVPTYNRAHVIAETLDSVFAQHYRSVEVVVVDDGSTDGTDAALRPYVDRITLVRSRCGNPGGARNVALREARGEFVAWLDSDDLWAPEKLSLQIAVVETLPATVLVSTDFWAFAAGEIVERSHIATYYTVLRRVPGGLDGIYGPPRQFPMESEREGSWVLPVYAGDVRDALVLGNFVHPSTVLMRHQAMREAGPADSTLLLSEWELFLRLARSGPFAHLDRPLVGYRLAPDQVSGEQNLLRIRLEILEIVRRVPREFPEYVARAGGEYRRRLAECHLGVARAAAARDRRLALRHLARSVRLGLVRPLTFRTLAGVSLPARLRLARQAWRGGRM